MFKFIKDLMLPTKGKIQAPKAVTDNKSVSNVTRSIEELLTKVDVDAVLSDPVKKRVVFISRSSNIDQLLSAAHGQVKLNHSTVAVSLYDYFKSTHLPPSVCLQRLSAVSTNGVINSMVELDISDLVAALQFNT